MRAVRVDRAQLIDLAIALPIALLGVLEALARDNTGRWLTAAVVNGAAVAFRRRSPLVALTAVVAVQALAHDATYDTDPLSPFLAELILMFTVAYQLRLRLALLGYAIGVAYVALDFGSGRIDEVAQAAAQCGFYLLAWGLGRMLHGHEERRVAAERHVVRVELEREEQARAAVADERARIARELHDAVAHSVSVMVLQAGGVRRLLRVGPGRERERDALAGIEQTGRQAVGELHRMLGILRKSEPDLAPSPSLRRVDELVEQVRSAGLDATLSGRGRAGRAPAGPRHVGLPDRAGGVDQRAPLRARRDRGRDRELRARAAARGPRRRRAGERPRRHARVRPRDRRHARARRAVRRRARRRPGVRRRLPRPCEASAVIRVVVADDQALVRAGLKMVLDAEADIEVVGEAADGEEVLGVVRRTRPEVVLMDIRMPVLDGLEASRRLLATDEPPKVVVLTTFDEEEYLYEALRAGTSGFLLKVSPPEQLIGAVRTVAAGNALIDPAVTQRVIEAFGRRVATAPPPPSLQELTARELEVLELMARGLSNQEIANELIVGDATVKTHVARVLMKLGLRDRVQAVVFAYEHGIVEPGAGT